LLTITHNQRTSPMDESIGLPVTALEKSNLSIIEYNGAI
jgi:hypothetical protein